MRMLTALVALTAVTALSSTASAASYALHVGGMCSTSFLDGSGHLLNKSGITSVNIAIDQHDDFDGAVQVLRGKLDQYCRNGNRCKIFAHSNGGAIVSRTLSQYGVGQWGVDWSINMGSAELGSPLADLADTWYAGWLADLIQCPMAGEIAGHRHGWDHHDTDGRNLYQIAGRDGWWYSSWFLGGEDDGAVKMAAAGAYVSDGSYDHACEGSAQFSQHMPVYWCGFDRDHYQVKTRGVDCYQNGGCDYD